MIASQWAEMIHFGTSGWRGVVGQELTFRNVRLLLEATVEVLRNRGETGEVLVSYDTRLLSEKFAREAVAVFTHHSVRTVISDRDLPSPCVAWATRERRASLGVIFTASHNPAEYNGVKLFTREGTAAPRELSSDIEVAVRACEARPPEFHVPQPHLARTETLSEGYLSSLQREIDWEAIRRSGIVVAVDPLYGSAREFLDRLLIANDVPTHVLHAIKDPYFAGYSPECSPPNLAGLRELIRTSGAVLGLATDGDADRFGVIDGECRATSANIAIALLVDYLIRRRGLRGGIGRTVGTTRLIDRLAAAASCEVVETPVGFGEFGPLFLSGRIAAAAEESAGLGVASHLPDRDGIYAALLVAEMVAVEGASIAELTRRLFARTGALLSVRVQLPWSDRVSDGMASLADSHFDELAGQPVLRADRRDGVLLELEGGAWVLLRPAGTEPKLRIYAEAPTGRQLRTLVREARRLLLKDEGEG